MALDFIRASEAEQLPKDNILPEYLCYVVRHMHLEKYFSGATIPRIYFKDYKSEMFNLGTIEKQEEIVGILGQVERVILNRQQQLQTLDELVKARFIEMFAKNDSAFNWPCQSISDVSTEMRTGPFGSALHHDEFVDSGIFVLGIWIIVYLQS